MWSIFNLGSYQRMVSLTVGTFVLCPLLAHQTVCIPSESSFAQEYLRPVNVMDGVPLIEKFDQLQEFAESDLILLEEGRNFFQSFINEINTKYGMNLTILDACKLVRENIHSLNIPTNMHDTLLSTITLLESNPVEMQFFLTQDHLLAKIYWPTEWNWFGLNKKKHNHKKEQQAKSHNHHQIPTANASSRLQDIDLPSNYYIGGVELLTGALILILPFPGAQHLGGLIIGDGVRRVIDGTLQLGEERRTNPNFVPLKFDPPFDNL